MLAEDSGLVNNGVEALCPVGVGATKLLPSGVISFLLLFRAKLSNNLSARFSSSGIVGSWVVLLPIPGLVNCLVGSTMLGARPSLLLAGTYAFRRDSASRDRRPYCSIR